MNQDKKQYDGESVALPARESLNGRLPGHEAIGWNAYRDAMEKLGPLYAHAEVERLRAACEAEFRSVEVLNEANQKLQAHLAEAQALLRDIELTMDAQEDSVSLGYDIEMRMATILRPSASAEPGGKNG